MKYFAKIENNIVVNTVVSESIDLLEEGNWIEYSLDGEFRGNRANIGSSYRLEEDVFINIKPHASWNLNTENWQWEAPTPKPNDAYYNWDEDSLSWYKMKDFE
jgi:hypothetical protein